MTDDMRWCVVGAACLIAVLLTITAMILLIPSPGPPASCVGHGGVVRVHEAKDTSAVYFICRDGKVLDRP